MKIFLAFTGFFIAALFLVFGVALGTIFSAPIESQRNETLSMLGTWASSFGTILAVMAVILVAKIQIDETSRQGQIRATNYAKMIVGDLIERVSHQKRMLEEGFTFVAPLNSNAAVIERRYEGLFLHDLYEHLPGPVLISINNLASDFFKLGYLTALLSTTQDLSSLSTGFNEDSPVSKTFTRLLASLAELEDQLHAHSEQLQ